MVNRMECSGWLYGLRKATVRPLGRPRCNRLNGRMGQCEAGLGGRRLGVAIELKWSIRLKEPFGLTRPSDVISSEIEAGSPDLQQSLTMTLLIN